MRFLWALLFKLSLNFEINAMNIVMQLQDNNPVKRLIAVKALVDCQDNQAVDAIIFAIEDSLRKKSPLLKIKNKIIGRLRNLNL
jgi:hypothetical protein